MTGWRKPLEYTSIDFSSREGEALLGQYFITQSVLGIRQILVWVLTAVRQLDQKRSIQQNNHDLEEERKGQSKEKRQVKVMATTIRDALKACKASSVKKRQSWEANLLQMQGPGTFLPEMTNSHLPALIATSDKGEDSEQWMFSCPCSYRRAWSAKTGCIGQSWTWLMGVNSAVPT
jgi:hypothetical protein